jgi:hypothetical protein
MHPLSRMQLAIFSAVISPIDDASLVVPEFLRQVFRKTVSVRRSPFLTVGESSRGMAKRVEDCETRLDFLLPHNISSTLNVGLDISATTPVEAQMFALDPSDLVQLLRQLVEPEDVLAQLNSSFCGNLPGCQDISDGSSNVRFPNSTVHIGPSFLMDGNYPIGINLFPTTISPLTTPMFFGLGQPAGPSWSPDGSGGVKSIRIVRSGDCATAFDYSVQVSDIVQNVISQELSCEGKATFIRIDKLIVVPTLFSTNYHRYDSRGGAFLAIQVHFYRDDIIGHCTLKATAYYEWWLMDAMLRLGIVGEPLIKHDSGGACTNNIFWLGGLGVPEVFHQGGAADLLRDKLKNFLPKRVNDIAEYIQWIPQYLDRDGNPSPAQPIGLSSTVPLIQQQFKDFDSTIGLLTCQYEGVAAPHPMGPPFDACPDLRTAINQSLSAFSVTPWLGPENSSSRQALLAAVNEIDPVTNRFKNFKCEVMDWKRFADGAGNSAGRCQIAARIQRLLPQPDALIAVMWEKDGEIPAFIPGANIPGIARVLENYVRGLKSVSFTNAGKVTSNDPNLVRSALCTSKRALPTFAPPPMLAAPSQLEGDDNKGMSLGATLGQHGQLEEQGQVSFQQAFVDTVTRMPADGVRLRRRFPVLFLEDFGCYSKDRCANQCGTFGAEFLIKTNPPCKSDGECSSDRKCIDGACLSSEQAQVQGCIDRCCTGDLQKWRDCFCSNGSACEH